MVITVVVCGTSLSKKLSDWQQVAMRMAEQSMPVSTAVICQDNVGLSVMLSWSNLC